MEALTGLAGSRWSGTAELWVDPLDRAGQVIGWIGGIPHYAGRVWELHPLVVAEPRRGHGVGRALVEDLERLAAASGAWTR